jgi:ATP-binding cassette subfamily B protein
VAQAYHSTVISQGIVATLRRQLFGRLLDQPVGFFTDRKAGDLLSRINTDIDGVEDVVTDTVFGLVSSALVTIATLGLMLRFSWPLTLVVLVLIPLVALPARRAGRATYAARSRTQSYRGQMTAYLQEILGISGIMLVKAFGAERRERQRFAGMNGELRGQARLPAGDAPVGEADEAGDVSHEIPPYRFPGGGEGQAAQHDSREMSRVKAWAARRRASDMVR